MHRNVSLGGDAELLYLFAKIFITDLSLRSFS